MAVRWSCTLAAMLGSVTIGKPVASHVLGYTESRDL